MSKDLDNEFERIMEQLFNLEHKFAELLEHVVSTHLIFFRNLSILSPEDETELRKQQDLEFDYTLLTIKKMLDCCRKIQGDLGAARYSSVLGLATAQKRVEDELHRRRKKDTE